MIDKIKYFENLKVLKKKTKTRLIGLASYNILDNHHYHVAFQYAPNHIENSNHHHDDHEVDDDHEEKKNEHHDEKENFGRNGKEDDDHKVKIDDDHENEKSAVDKSQNQS